MKEKRGFPRTLAVLLSLALSFSYPAAAAEKKIRILCSFLPIQVFAANVIHGRSSVELDVLIPGQSGPHNYQLTPGDMRKIASADLFFAVGLGLESFLGGPIRQANPHLKVVETGRISQLIRYADLDRRDIHHEAQKHEKKESHHASHSYAMEYNPHPWVSPLAAVKMVRTIEKALTELDPEGAAFYQANAERYTQRLMALHEKIASAVTAFPNKKIVTFHDAFDYFARDHGLQVVAVLEEVAGQSPSAGEVQKIVETIKKTGAAGVFAEPQFSPALARTIAEEAKVPLGILDPMATGSFSLEAYEQVMRKNLEELNRVLGKK